jgi:ABC-type transport system involved in multi-copper enzyme maturation permease subunit
MTAITTPTLTRSLRERLTANPIVLKELRGRMRGNRAYLVITAYTGLMGLFAILLYLGYTASISTNVYDSSSQLVGKVVFGGVVGVELFMVCFIAPAFTAGAISGERERQTYELLRTTLMPARSLVLGKLTSALSFIILLLFIALPVQSLAFLLGGVALEEVLIALVILLATALASGASGIFFSALMRRTLGASVVTYAFALVVVVGVPVVALLAAAFTGPYLGSIFYGGYSPTATEIMIQLLLMLGLWALVCLNPLAAGLITEIMLISGEHNAFTMTTTTAGGQSITLPVPWIPYTLICLFFSLITILLSIQLVRRKETT